MYKKFLHVPLYLEWAPKDVFTTPAPAAPLARAKLPASQQQQPEQQQQGAPAPAAKYAGAGKCSTGLCAHSSRESLPRWCRLGEWSGRCGL